MRNIKFITILIVVAIFSACSKGDMGATGSQGTTGAAGQQGPAGTNGVSDLTITTYTISGTSWTAYNSNTWYYVTASSVPLSDAINIYVSLNGAAYTPLPTNSFFTSGDNLTYVFGNTGNVTLWEYDNTSQPAVDVYVEVADIPPSVYVKNPNVNWNNYNEVSSLPEFQAALKKK